MNSDPLYICHRFPGEVIRHRVWPCSRVSSIYRDVEERMAERDVSVTYGTIREWSRKLDRAYAKWSMHRAARPGDRWYLNAMVIKIRGRQQFPWRKVDQDGEELDILVQSRRSKRAAMRFFRKLRHACCYVPHSITPDELRRSAAATEALMPNVLHRQDKRLNDRAENAHQPTPQRENGMRRFNLAKHAQEFLTVFSVAGRFFRVGRHLLTPKNYRRLMRGRFYDWREVVGTPAAL